MSWEKLQPGGRYMVTGGAGFIGANFVLDWLAQNLRGRRSEPDPDPVEASPQY